MSWRRGLFWLLVVANSIVITYHIGNGESPSLALNAAALGFLIGIDNG